MSAFRRAVLTVVLVAAAIPASASAAALAAPVPADMAALPTAAIAIGDSFISGEGAGAYQPVVDTNGVAQGFPGWSAPNSNAFFCHRSANASLHQASLPGIQARFNLACSGGQPFDITNAPSGRTNGRTVKSQLDQVRAVAQTNDIDLVLVGLGSNNSSFTFGDVASKCASRFIADAWTGWGEFWAYINGPIEQDPCTANDLASPAPGHAFSTNLGNIVRSAHTTLSTEFPGADLVYLNVQQAFNGARLCEVSANPATALATPVRVQDGPSGVPLTSLAGKDKIAIKKYADTCITYFQTCQESWHPNAAGHAVLGQCLASAATTASRTVACIRQPTGAITIS